MAEPYQGLDLGILTFFGVRRRGIVKSTTRALCVSLADRRAQADLRVPISANTVSRGLRGRHTSRRYKKALRWPETAPCSTSKRGVEWRLAHWAMNKCAEYALPQIEKPIAVRQESVSRGANYRFSDRLKQITLSVWRKKASTPRRSSTSRIVKQAAQQRLSS